VRLRMQAEEIICRVSDEEIIENYLRPKINGETSSIPRYVVELAEELYTVEPWLLPRQTAPILNPGEWFYFGKRNRKYSNLEGVHCEGSWILEDGCIAVLSKETGEEIGGTTRFRYYYRNKGDKESRLKMSNWFMREYRLYYKSRRVFNGRQVFCIITCNDEHFIE